MSDVETTAPAILDLALVLLLAAAAGWAARQVRLPAVVGYLVIGIVVSPFTPGFVADREQLQVLADVGVILLLFEVGIEIDIGHFRARHRELLWASPVQVAVTMALAGIVAWLAGLEPLGAAFVGLCVAMSSSVVVVNITRSVRRTTDVSTEQTLLGWSLLQDITLVVLTSVLLAVAGRAERSPVDAVAGFVAFAAISVGVAWALPRVLRRLHAQPDLFLVVSVASGLAVAGIGSTALGVPLALAAFVAGLAITDSDEATEAQRRLLPFRDLFAVLFFVAIGTLLDPGALGAGIGWLALLVGLVVVAKVGVVYVIARVSGVSTRPAQLAVGLGQVGEFSFVLASVARSAELIPNEVHVAVIATVATTIAASTVAVRMAGRLYAGNAEAEA